MSLKINNLSVSLENKKILENISFEVRPGELHALMGPNGSGKSTLAVALAGHPNYTVNGNRAEIRLNQIDLLNKNPTERALAGLFLAFQNPISIPGVTVSNLLKTAYQIKNPGKMGKQTGKYTTLSVWKFHELLVEKAKILGIPKEFLGRTLNEQFSGGEKKKLEMLQAVVLEPKYAVFDEIDTGLDVDALKIVARGIKAMKMAGSGIIVITHYQRILRFAKPDFVHILISGRIVRSGGQELAREVEKNGYKKWIKN